MMLKRLTILGLTFCLFACSNEPSKPVQALPPAIRFSPYEQKLDLSEGTGSKFSSNIPETFKVSEDGRLLGIPRSPAGEYEFAFGELKCLLKVVEQPHALPDVPVSCDFACACTYKGKVYLFGGRTDAAIFTGHANCYDPVAKKWEELPAMPHPKERAAAAALGGKIYVIGGYSGEDSVLVDVFDPRERAWSDGPLLSTARYEGCAAVAGGKIYYIGGWISCTHEHSGEA